MTGGGRRETNNRFDELTRVLFREDRADAGP